MKKFDPKKYKQEYNKQKYKRIYVDIEKDLGERFDQKLKDKKKTRAEILIPAIKKFLSDCENEPNIKIGFECSELIEELKKDIKEFGNVEMYAFFKEIDGITFLTDYDFIMDDEPLQESEITDYKYVEILNASKILYILEKQNSIDK